MVCTLYILMYLCTYVCVCYVVVDSNKTKKTKAVRKGSTKMHPYLFSLCTYVHSSLRSCVKIFIHLSGIFLGRGGGGHPAPPENDPPPP